MSMMRLAATLAAATVLLATGACTTAPTHPALAGAQQGGQLPPLVPLRRFVANIDSEGGFSLSPDGQRLLWQRTVGLDSGLAVRPVADSGAVSTFATGVLPRLGSAGAIYAWLPDSRHVAYLKDFSGDENTQLFVLDTQAGGTAPWAVTPWPGVRSTFAGRAQPGSTRFFFASNRRDRATMDLYEADAATRTFREVARSDGSVTGWIMGADHRLAGRARQLGRADGSDVVFELLQAGGDWRALKTVGGFDHYWVHRLDLAAGKAWATSNIGRDKTALVEVDLASGQERVLGSDHQVDLSFPLFAPQGAPLGYVVEPGLARMQWLDTDMAGEVQAAVRKALAAGLLMEEPVLTRPQGFAENAQRVVLRSVGNFDSAELLLDRASGQVTRLDPVEKEAAALLSPQQPFSFKASDGRVIHGYLTRPRGVTGAAPLVVDIHGGPWTRDNWAPATFHPRQLLANRGYAVLQVNYRGSAGYGREHMWAGAHEYFGRLQKDVAEGVQWAIDQGAADSQRIAVLGGSFGGFSVLAQLIQKPHDYRCGIDVVGVANWPRVVDNWPPFWRSRHYFARFYGDVNQPEERARMLANSPITHVEKITAPLLVVHGGNDVRVLRQDSDDVVEALRKLGRPVDYMLFADEGHSIRKWRNRLAMWRRIEDTLASCLGGRSAGFDFYELMPR